MRLLKIIWVRFFFFFFSILEIFGKKLSASVYPVDPPSLGEMTKKESLSRGVPVVDGDLPVKK